MIIISRSILYLLTGRFAESIALWPFIFLSRVELKNDAILLNHERIHLRQQVELLILIFYIWYILEYLIYRAKGINHYSAYRCISFEKEAYNHERDLQYLKTRKFYNFLVYLRSK